MKLGKIWGFGLLGLFWADMTFAKEVVHDAEYYVLKVQNGENWAAEDKELNAKLAALKEKYGKPPNIIHITRSGSRSGTSPEW